MARSRVFDRVAEHACSTSRGSRLFGRIADGLFRRDQAIRLLGKVGGQASISDVSENWQRLAGAIAPDFRVRFGPCAGMKYPSLEGWGSTLPKLAGSYESELHAVLESCIARRPSAVVDVGCAEGFYAIGLALRLPGVPVFAFDIDPVAQQRANAMAQVNGVSEQVQVDGECSPARLLQLMSDRAPSLVILDCEGHESDLCSEALLSKCHQHSFIVECHDFVKPGVTEILQQRAQASHRVVRVTSMPDLIRCSSFALPEMAGLSYEDRLRIVSEHRPARMHWLVLTPMLLPVGV